MRFNLRNFVLASAGIAALATTAAMAETTVKVPFNFTVAGKNCPAGTYTVVRSTFGTLVTLKSVDSPKTFSWALRPGDPAPTDVTVVLEFDAQGQTHALRSVQYGPLTTSRLDQNNKQSERLPARTVQGE